MTGNKLTALYCRLSLDDGNEGESMSIQSQKAILENYARNAGIINYEFYVDDGYSGTNFNRPSFQKMISDIEDGKIECIITKDLSRLGRNYLESGAYIEVFFPKHKVRYIAVNDGVDSMSAAGLDITPFKNILNEFYSRDISKKVKTGKHIRAASGKYMCTHAPFGYNKDPEDRNHLLIDEQTAPIVRRIFELALEGMGNNRISKILKKERLPRPAFFKQEYFGKYFDNIEGYYDWTQSIITRILRNPLYKGDMWLHTTSKSTFNSKSRGYIGTHEREIVQNTHEGIVSREVWDTVQEIMNRHSKVRPSNSGYENLFRGILKCPDCGRSLLLHTDTRKKCEARLASYFQCSTYRMKGRSACEQHRIEAVDLEKAVLEDIQKNAKKAMKNPESFIRKILSGMASQSTENADKLEKRIRKLEAENADTDRLYIKCYEDYSNGIIDKSRFQLLSSHYTEKQSQNNALIEKYRAEMEWSRKSNVDALLFTRNISEYAEIKQLTGTMINRLIEKIEVFEPKVIDGEKKLKIRIHYRCVGAIE